MGVTKVYDNRVVEYLRCFTPRYTICEKLKSSNLKCPPRIHGIRSPRSPYEILPKNEYDLRHTLSFSPLFIIHSSCSIWHHSGEEGVFTIGGICGGNDQPPGVCGLAARRYGLTTARHVPLPYAKSKTHSGEGTSMPVHAMSERTMRDGQPGLTHSMKKKIGPDGYSAPPYALSSNWSYLARSPRCPRWVRPTDLGVWRCLQLGRKNAFGYKTFL